MHAKEEIVPPWAHMERSWRGRAKDNMEQKRLATTNALRKWSKKAQKVLEKQAIMIHWGFVVIYQPHPHVIIFNRI